MTTITKEQAIAILRDSEAEHLPLPSLTDDGRVAVAEFVRDNAAHPERHNLGEWYSTAEWAAAETPVGETVTVEMRGQFTPDGRPGVLHLSPDAFVWDVGE